MHASTQVRGLSDEQGAVGDETAVERIRHTCNSQGQLLALALRQKSVKGSKLFFFARKWQWASQTGAFAFGVLTNNCSVQRCIINGRFDKITG